MEQAQPSAWLIPLSGPGLLPLEISPTLAGVVLGRSETCSIQLPSDAQKVSRQHVRFARDSARWRIADLGSRWGTYLNGQKLLPHTDTALGEGDLIRIEPYTFHFSTRGIPRRGMKADDDSNLNATFIRSYSPNNPAQDDRLAADMLPLLLESAAAIHAATDEKSLAETLIDTALRGTGLTNAAVIRPVDAEGRLEIIAVKMHAGDSSAQKFSRSLITAASEGVVAELSGQDAGDISQSIVQMRIRAALCVPIMLGTAVAAYLYLDSRGHHTLARQGAAPFCLALGRMAGLALANLKRIEMEKRQTAIEFDLTAAAKAQQWILPKRETQIGPLTIIGQSRPGQFLGGDFFDIIPLDDHRTAVALGDVSGHGVAASVLMTAAQGFLHASLRNNPSLADAVSNLNEFICPRCPPQSFLTLWVGIFDLQNNTIDYVNAGHGYAMLSGPRAEIQMLDGGEDLPIGFDESARYSSIRHPLEKQSQFLVVSDGLVEQFSSDVEAREQFGLQRVKAHLSGDDIVTKLFEAVIQHAGTSNLQDDATAVWVRTQK